MAEELKKDTPLIDKWTYELGMLWGLVYNDLRWKDGTPIRTSTVKEINEAEGWAQTRNTYYLLGSKGVAE